MIYGSATLKAHVAIENLTVGAVTTVTTAVISVAVTNGNFVAGDGVLVNVRSATGLGAAINVYGVVIDATHIGLCFPNQSAGALTPAATLDYDVYVFGAQKSIVGA